MTKETKLSHSNALKWRWSLAVVFNVVNIGVALRTSITLLSPSDDGSPLSFGNSTAHDGFSPETNVLKATPSRERRLRVHVPIQDMGARDALSNPASKRSSAEQRVAGKDHDTKAGTVRAVSYSLYGKDPRYWKGMIHVAQLTPEKYPNWQVWIYHDTTVPQKALQQLGTMPHVTLINVETDLPPWVHQQLNPMTWRFLIASDPRVEAYAVRDCDSLPSAREFAAVDEWIHSRKSFHFIRDHPMHDPQQFSPILGGMWGGWHRSVPNMDQLLQQYYATNNRRVVRSTKYGDDQDFLWNYIMPLAYQDVLQHDSYYCRESNAIAFPVSRENSEKDGHSKYWYVGNLFARENKVKTDRIIKRDAKRYQACLEDRQTLEAELQQQQNIAKEAMAQHFNTTYTGEIRGLSTDAWRKWSQTLNKKKKKRRKNV